MSHKMFTAALLVMSLVAVTAAEAGIGTQFRAGISHFRRLESGQWEELQNGTPRFRFVETARGNNYVLMFDASRSISVKLTENRIIVTQNSVQKINTIGHWLWQEWRSADGRGRLVHQGNGDWTEYLDGNPTWRFREVSRGLDQIQLYDASRGITLKLSPTSNVISSGSDTLMTVAGGWSK